MSKGILYYSHCMAIYHTPQEERDLDTIKKMFGDEIEIINPSDKEHSDIVGYLKSEKMDAKVMPYFENLVKKSNMVVFRAAINGKIPSGVYKELMVAYDYGIPILELPSMITSREMTLGQTGEMLAELGQR